MFKRKPRCIACQRSDEVVQIKKGAVPSVRHYGGKRCGLRWDDPVSNIPKSHRVKYAFGRQNVPKNRDDA